MIPRQYAKEQVGAQYLPTEYLLDLLAKDQQMMYALPMLYINSGFQRRYLKTLLQKTGKLLDGVSQDIPMAIINCCIHERVLSMIYPITIAGMSSASIGYLNNRPDGEKETNRDKSAKRCFSRRISGFTSLESGSGGCCRSAPIPAICISHCQEQWRRACLQRRMQTVF